MRAAVIKVITTVCLIVNILVTNVESASLNIHLSVNPQKIVARCLTSGFNVVCLPQNVDPKYDFSCENCC